jgi:delta 1-pyrroline-5-carboxylate dehydrogenase
VERGFKKAAAALLLVIGAVALFGCGSDSSSGSSLTKAEFIKQVNLACQQEAETRIKAKNEKQEELGINFGEVATPAQHKQIVEVTVLPYEKMTDQLKNLIPSDQTDALAPLVEAREELAKIVRETNSLEKTLPAIKKANELAVQYGLKECFI